MPNQDIKSVIDTKPVTFTLKTGGGKWKCTLHGDRHGYPYLTSSRSEKHRNANGNLARTDSDMSASSSKTTSSAGSVSSTH
ncbi:hypothetical protein KJ359_006090 [Pestalotiopsis sp. 9143b]|nr:hypothetical protein KJ359_006090 [Pestalotiopsis sp. 9143b]